MLRIFVFCLFISVLSGCKKYDSIDKNITEHIISDGKPFQKVVFLNDSLAWACGGWRSESGYLYKSIDGGQSWTSQSIFYSNKKVYDLYFLNDSMGFAGTEDNFYYSTSNSGKNWFGSWSIALAHHEVHRPAIRRFYFLNDTAAYFVAGDNYETGTLYYTNDGGENWSFDTLKHELKAIDFYNDQVGLVGGYGYLGKIDGPGGTYSQLDHDEDYYIGVKLFSTKEYLAVGQNGGIYKSYDGGDNWTVIQKDNGLFGKRFFFSDMAFVDNQTGIISGLNGLILLTTDKGESWRQISTNTQAKLNRITFLNQTAIIATDGGSYFKIKL